MAILADADPGAPVLVTGYEGGYTTVAGADLCPMQQLDRGDADWYGPFETPAEAAAQTTPRDPATPFAAACGPPPTLIGEPVVALVISRCGR